MDDSYLGDMHIVAKFLSAIEANILCSFLQSFGLEAQAGDTNLVQTDSLLTIATGGACVRVPQMQVAEAKEIIAARERVELEIDESFDPNE